MKKIAALLLCLSMLSAGALTAYAEEPNTAPGEATIGTEVPDSHKITMNAIDLYVRQLAANSINTINNLTAVVQRGVENYSLGAGSQPEGYDEAIKYINETKVDEDEFLRYRITERFNQILRDLYAEHNADAQKQAPPIISETNAMTAYMVDILDKVKSGEVQLDSPEQAALMLAERMGVSEERMKAIMKLLSDND